VNSERLTADVLDPCLQAFFDAPVESSEEDAAMRLLMEQVTPVIEGVIRGKLFGATAAVEREEVTSEVMLQLIKRLQEMKSDPSRNPITNFDGYAAVTTFNVIHAHTRRAFPERQRLRNRVRHVIRKSSRYALWQTSSGQQLCGLDEWRTSQPARRDYEQLLDSVPPIASRAATNWKDNISGTLIAQLLEHIFGHVRQPVELERVVEKVAELLRLPVLAGAAMKGIRVDQAPSIESSLVYRSALMQVWREIGLLPPRQRVALLLGVRDEDGAGVMSLVVVLRIATLDELARTLELTVEELAEIWDQLPWPDMTIAERLGLTRQQVINLRKSARERLGRRLAFLRDGNPLLE
jgi:hypothetical protein